MTMLYRKRKRNPKGTMNVLIINQGQGNDFSKAKLKILKELKESTKSLRNTHIFLIRDLNSSYTLKIKQNFV